MQVIKCAHTGTQVRTIIIQMNDNNHYDHPLAQLLLNLIGTWSTKGCTEVLVSGDVTTCECTYMAHFGILFVSYSK